MSLRPATREALKLLHDGSVAMARIEAAGMRVDVSYLKNAITQTSKHIADLEAALRNSKEYKVWARRYGNATKIQSKVQLGSVIFGEMGHKRNPFMTGNDEAAFEHLKKEVPFLQAYYEVVRLKKALRTNLYGILNETVDGFVHPFFDLHTTESYRPSSSKPNFQNVPVRNKDISRIVRSCIIPRPGRVFLEVDYSTQEVRVSYCYNKDPKLLYDVQHGDMHRDRAKDLYLLTDEQMGPNNKEPGKSIRYCAKNKFVFAQFYGDYYGHCAPNLWDSISLLDLKRTDGVCLFDHLKEKGISRIGACDPEKEPIRHTFEHHVMEVENKMWKENYTVYDQWKRDWWNMYMRQGGVNTLTGFKQEGVFRRNQILCDSIQGCLPGHVKVLTDAGHVAIKSLVGKHVMVWTGFKWASATAIPKGKWQQAKVYLSSGIVVECDTRHKFKNELNQWIDFSDLQIDSYVALPVVGPVQEALPGVNWWFFLGFALGDAYLAKQPTQNGNSRKYLSITVGEKKKPILEEIRCFLLRHGYRPSQIGVVSGRGVKKDSYRLRIEDRHLVSFMEMEFGMVFGKKARTKRIPKKVWTATLLQQRDFMEGLWLSDGNRDVGQKRNIHTPNLVLLRQVQRLIAPLGFDSSISKTSTGHLLRVCADDGVDKPSRIYPKESILNVTDSISVKNYTDMSEYSTDTSSFYRKGNSQSQRVGQRIIQRADPQAQVYRFDRVTKIEILDRQERTYTMNVDDELHQFVAGDVITKNSAFHCLLWSIIQIQKELIRGKFDTKVVNQVHDSCLLDVPVAELPDVINIVKETMIDRVMKHWSWIITPLVIELELCESNWYEKTPYKVAVKESTDEGIRG